jgi:hypothetical protein
VKQEADRVNDEAKSDPANAPSIYQRYVQAWQNRMLQGKQKAQGAVQDKKVNVAMVKEDSIFPNISLPGGISSKASEYKELARKGEKWESPVFSIGSAHKSNDIPSAPKIEKKPHNVTDPHAPGTNGATNGHTNGHTNGASNGQTYVTGNSMLPSGGTGLTGTGGDNYALSSGQATTGATGTGPLPSLDVNQGGLGLNTDAAGRTTGGAL